MEKNRNRMNETIEAQLTLKDRINFPYILANQILTFQKALLALEFSDREVRESIEGFVQIIPSSWRDKKFNEDLEQAKINEKLDMRPLVAGNIRMSKECCKKLGITAYKTKETFDYYKMFHACIDLLDRRGLASKKTYTEKIDGWKINET